MQEPAHQLEEDHMTDICEVCGKPIGGEPVHFLHRADCREGCGCRRPVHVACCPEPVCVAERGDG